MSDDAPLHNNLSNLIIYSISQLASSSRAQTICMLTIDTAVLLMMGIVGDGCWSARLVGMLRI